jgi:hypothetical protein
MSVSNETIKKIILKCIYNMYSVCDQSNPHVEIQSTIKIHNIKHVLLS